MAVVAALVAASACSSAPPQTAAADPEQGVVTFVVDGDTIHVRLASGAKEKVRLIGIDTPEVTNPVERYGREASMFASKLLNRKTVWLELDTDRRDRYGRLLAYVWLVKPVTGGMNEMRANMANAILVRDGYANQLTVPPNVRYTQRFRTLEKEARNAHRGLWK